MNGKQAADKPVTIEERQLMELAMLEESVDNINARLVVLTYADEPEKIVQEVRRQIGDITEGITRVEINLREEGICKVLTRMGWMTPETKTHLLDCKDIIDRLATLNVKGNNVIDYVMQAHKLSDEARKLREVF